MQPPAPISCACSKQINDYLNFQTNTDRETQSKVSSPSTYPKSLSIMKPVKLPSKSKRKQTMQQRENQNAKQAKSNPGLTGKQSWVILHVFVSGELV